MTPERAARLVARWVRRYTHTLPRDAAERRMGEIDADVHDHVAHERAAGRTERRIAIGVLARMVRGLPADVAWRHAQKERSRMSRSTIRVAAATAFVLLVPAVGMLISDEVDWGVADFVLAGVLVAGAGLLLEVAARTPRNVAPRVAAGAIGVAAIVLGNADDAPGLVLFGGLIVVGTVALTIRTAQRRR